jgi:DNA-binding transcriptional LysR family regulator
VTLDTTDEEDDRVYDEASHVEDNPMRMGDAAVRAMSIKISWLRSFLAVADRGGFGAAAQAIHLSQSRVSAHIAALESALGFTLFKRTSRPIALTHAGQIFRGHAERALEELQEAIVSVRAAHGMRQRRIVVASYPSVSSVFLPSVLSILLRDHPDITVELVESTSAAALEDTLTSGVADVAFRPLQPPLHGEAFRATSLWRESIVAVMRSDDPLAQLTAIGIGDLEGRALIGNPSGTEEEGGGFDLRHAIGDAASSMTIAYLSDQPATVVALVRGAFGVGVISQLALVTVSLEGLAARPIESPTAFRDVGILWSEGRENEAAVQAFLECVGKATVPHGVLAPASTDFKSA